MSTPVNPQFYYIKVGLKGSKLYRRVLVMFCHECFSMVSMTHFPFLFSYIYIIYVYDFALIVSYFRCNVLLCTVEPQWLEHLWDHGNVFETWVVRATEG